MPNLILWIVLLSIFKYTQQACTSTVAITTCSWDTVKSNKPLHINDYRTYLSFARGNLEYIPSGTFQYLPQVKILQLNYNKIKNLEDNSFLGLQDLKELNLYDNQLRIIGKNVFKHCRKLEKLNLGMNKIGDIHDDAFEDLVELKFLNLGFNSFKVVPSAVNSLQKLEILNLDDNNIENLKSNAFFNLNKLEQLFVNDNKITRIENHAFKGLMNLKQLDMRSNYLSELNVDDLLTEARRLKVISLNINDFKCSVLTQIVDKLKGNNVDVVRGVSKNLNNVNGMSCKK